MRAPQFNGKGKKRGKMRFASGVAVNDCQRQARPFIEGAPGFVRRDAPPASQGWLKRNDYRRSYPHQPSKGNFSRTIPPQINGRLALAAEMAAPEDGRFVLVRRKGAWARRFQYRHPHHSAKKPT